MISDPPSIDKDRLVAAIERLPAAERQIYLLCASDGLVLAAAARQLGLETAVAERLLVDALCALDRDLRRGERPWWRFW